tara:strand:+ start:141 stop:611 length:471 start_codon:yes stop_codon:yes gene_type:complete
MRNLALGIIALFVGVGSVNAQSFTDLNAVAYRGKIKQKQMLTALDANFALIEAGTAGGVTAANWTNTASITVSAGVYVISGTGGANDTTNTVTLVAPTVAGQEVTIMVATASTNLITIADSGTVAASGAILLDFNDVAVLRAIDTSTWVLVSESNN